MSRLDATRRSLHTTKVLLGAGSAAALAVFALAVRASHPGTHTPGGSASASTHAQLDEDTFDFGAGSIGPSVGRPSTASGAS
jgi:hypothetical protein